MKNHVWGRGDLTRDWLWIQTQRWEQRLSRGYDGVCSGVSRNWPRFTESLISRGKPQRSSSSQMLRNEKFYNQISKRQRERCETVRDNFPRYIGTTIDSTSMLTKYLTLDTLFRVWEFFEKEIQEMAQWRHFSFRKQLTRNV